MAAQPASSREVFRFGEYQISKLERLLLRGGRIVSLQARPFDLLLYLIENRHRVISRDELLSTVWAGVRVNEQAMRFAVHAVRRAIGDSGQAQRVIRTVRGTGLQFIGSVELLLQPAGNESIRPQVDHFFLGRELFLDRLARAVDDVESGRPRILLASGEAGIGKTTALTRVAALVASRGFRVGSARCIGTDEAPALWPWSQVLRQLIKGESEEWLEKAIENGAQEVAWILPEIRPFLSKSVSSTVDSRASRHRLLTSISSLIKNLSAQQPLALLMDDLHEGDQASLQLFGKLAANLDGSRALLFGTFRSQGAAYQRCSEVVPSVLRLRTAELVTLSGLSEDDVSIITETRSGSRPSSVVARDILAKTNGNPFFVSLILTVLENDGRLETLRRDNPLEYSLPRGIRDAVMRQVHLLPNSVRDLLGLAAVIEKDFSPSLLERALGSTTAAILDGLEAAIDSGVCVSDNEGVSCRFAHGLVREAINASLTVSERAESNGKIAIALCELVGADPGAHSAEIARHFAAAYPDPIAARAIGFLILAARWDVERAAFDSAAAHLERGANLLEKLCPGDTNLRCELWVERGWVYGLAGRRDDSRRALEEGVRLAEHCARPDLLARAALSFVPDLLAIETGVYDPDLVSLLELALRRLPAGHVERPRILARLAVALHWSDVPRERIGALVDQAIREVGSTDDAEMASFVRTAGKLALYSVEHAEESSRESEAAGVEDSSTSLMRMILRITALWQIGKMRDVEIEIEEFDSFVKRARRPSASWYVGMLKATMALMKGQYVVARELSESFLGQGVAVDDRNALHSFALQQALLAIDVGKLEDLEPAVMEMVSAFPRVEGWQAGLCYLYCEVGKVVEARNVMAALIGRGGLNSFPRNSWLGTLCSLTLASRVIKSPNIVPALYERWGQFTGQLAVVGFSSFCWGSTDRFLGILAGLMSKWDLAHAHFTRAIAVNESVGAGPALAHTYADLAAMLDRRRRGDGRELWERAIQQARYLGMANLERRILLGAHQRDDQSQG